MRDVYSELPGIASGIGSAIASAVVADRQRRLAVAWARDEAAVEALEETVEAKRIRNAKARRNLAAARRLAGK